jgi:gliding motility-associated-like protein
MTIGTNYTVKASLGTCTSLASASFSNALQLVTPAVPTLSFVLPTCSADGSSTISNYSATNTYAFLPAGPAVSATGLVTGMTVGTNYTVTATNNGCTSLASASFSNAAQLVTPAVPLISSVAASCSANGSSTISNYSASNTYTFTPSGPTVSATGLINGMTIGTNYTVKATLGTCTSLASASFSNALQLVTPAVPTLSFVLPTCSSDGSSTISNYSATNTYAFLPSGPAVSATGLVTGMTVGTNYTVTATNNGCTSLASASFSNAAQLVTPAVPLISSVAASCSANGSSTISNYSASNTYTFTPSGPTVSATGLINGMTIGTNYTVKATLGTCTSFASASFSNALQLAAPILLIAHPSAVCFPDVVDLTAAAISAGSDAGTLSYWTNSTATTSLNNPTSVAIGGTYYIKLSSSNGCSTIKPVTVTINPLPVVSLPNDAHLCIDINGNPTTTTLLPTGLSTALYNFVWYNDTTATSVLLPETGNTLTVTALGTYRVEVENKSTGCKNIASATVVSSLPPSTMQFVTSSYFADDAMITVNVTPPGVYEYQIDNGEFQESNQFIGLNSGDHTVYVRDKFGCDEIYATVKLLNFPHFFTPNGDDYNDRWNISDLGDQPNAKIYIFDRYGKLMKQITTAGEGWDGTFNKTPLPADDYWFTIEYQEQGVTKIFKSHFALKR